MPTIVQIGGYRTEMHTGREYGIPHVLVARDGQDVVVNLLTLAPFGNEPFRLPKDVRAYIRGHQEELLRRWDEYHG